MTWGGTRLVSALAAVASLALLLGGCGSDSGSSGSTGSTEAQEGAAGGAEGEGSSTQQGGGGGAEAGGEPDKGPKVHSVKEVSVPLEVSGGGSAQFAVKEGDNSIQEFGEESDESELETAAQAVHDFYVARAAGHWADACSRMSTSLREQLERLATKSSVRGCAPFLEAFTGVLSAAAWRQVTTIDAASLRREGEQGFLIYRGAEDTVYAMPLAEEDGEWKVTALSATTLGGA